MGQQIFIPHAGGSAVGARFLTNLVANGGADYVDYGLAAGGDVFFPSSITGFSAVFAFRAVQTNPVAGPQDYPLAQCVDDVGNGWQFRISASSKIYGDISTGSLVPDRSDMPMGRVFFATLTQKNTGNGDLYINGRIVATTPCPQPALVAPVRILLGGNGTPVRNYVQYLGFAFMPSWLSSAEVSQIYEASQDARRIVFPAAIAVNPHAIYNVETGLANTALWVPESNTMGAPNLPAINNGIAAGTLLTAPFHAAHSGWARVFA